MPIPRPRHTERWQQYVSRLMRDARMRREYPDNRQRMAVIAQTWRGVYGQTGVARVRGSVRPVKKNPPLVIVGNPPAQVLGAPLAIQYKHHEDGQYYEHKFGPGDVIELLDNGTVRIRNTKGKPLWGRF